VEAVNHTPYGLVCLAVADKSIVPDNHDIIQGQHALWMHIRSLCPRRNRDKRYGKSCRCA